MNERRAIYEVVNHMTRNTGNGPGMVRVWIDAALKWADENPGPQAQAIRDWTAHWQVRPFYTATELTPLFPALIVAFGILERPPAQMSARRLANYLDYFKLPKLRNAGNGTHFRHPYRYELEEFYIVEQIHKWRKAMLTQKEFENVAFGR